MKLIVAADLHLKEREPERLDVWKWVLQQAVDRRADGLLIAGDLFDSDSDASRLAGDVKRLTTDALPQGVPVVMIAGNHDPGLATLGWSGPIRVLQPNEYVGLSDAERDLDVRIHGLPYQRGTVLSEFTQSLALDEGFVHILLGHASYLSPKHPHIVEAIEEHGEANECLLYESDLQGVPVAHVLLGHWHRQQPLGGEPPVTYIGSTIPNSRREEGPRHIVELTISDDGVDMNPLPVEHPPGWFYASRTYDWLPLDEEANVEEVSQLVADAALPGCVLDLTIRGYSRHPIEGLRRRIRDALAPFEGQLLRLDVDDAELVQAGEFDHPLVERSLAELEGAELDERLMEEIRLTQDPSLVREWMETTLRDAPDVVRNRAKRLLFQALYEELME